MFFNPGGLLMLVLLVGVTGWVLKSLMVALHRIRKADGAGGNKLAEMEDRLRKVETATTSLLVDVTSMREKQRFMAKLQAAPAPALVAAPHEAARAENGSEAGVSPMQTQSIPIIPRARSPRQ